MTGLELLVGQHGGVLVDSWGDPVHVQRSPGGTWFLLHRGVLVAERTEEGLACWLRLLLSAVAWSPAARRGATGTGEAGSWGLARWRGPYHCRG